MVVIQRPPILLSGYMLQPATNPLLPTTEGSDTAIPCGSYDVQATYGGNYKWEITDVEGRSAIKIHSGTDHTNTSGCFIPGNSYQMTNGDYSVYGSKTTFNALDSILEQYGGGGIQINIVGYR
ncbi:DUF5675 family protein [uncultured Proteiniphilum sp.]|uniref:DUF5675 family protein n=1 Tax=uncultured Proteiniphilum sp. TaxID=497637 RepID=UPI00344F83B7